MEHFPADITMPQEVAVWCKDRRPDRIYWTTMVHQLIKSQRWADVLEWLQASSPTAACALGTETSNLHRSVLSQLAFHKPNPVPDLWEELCNLACYKV